MAAEREALRDWHRLFGLLLTDFFTGSLFTVEVEPDLSVQQQLLDVAVVRRGRGRFRGRLPDGLDLSAEHNLVTFKSHHEALDDWAIRELIGHYVAYRKLVSPSTSELLAAERFRLYGVCARFPHNLVGQIPWQEQQAGVYDCRWGLDVVRVIVAGQLPREQHNAPLHLFSASPELVRYAGGAYRQRSDDTSALLKQLFEKFRGEGLTMPFTMEDFRRQFVKEHFHELTPEEQEEVLKTLSPEQRLAGLPAEQRLAGLSAEQIEQVRQYLDRLSATRPSAARKPRRRN
jgi:hypothetical protein